MLYFIEVFDLFLLGTVMLIMALSLYELFMDSDLKLPARLEIRTFEDLKTNLVTVVIAVMAVTFLGQIVSWNGQTDAARPRRGGGARDRRAERLPLDREAGEEVGRPAAFARQGVMPFSSAQPVHMIWMPMQSSMNAISRIITSVPTSPSFSSTAAACLKMK